MYSFHFALSKIQQGKFYKGVFRAVNFNLNEQDLFWKKVKNANCSIKFFMYASCFFFISVLNIPANGKDLFSKETNEELDTSKVKYWATEKNNTGALMKQDVRMNALSNIVSQFWHMRSQFASWTKPIWNRPKSSLRGIGKSIVTWELVLFSIVYIGC